MRNLLAILATSSFALGANAAAPLVIEESEILPEPPGGYVRFGNGVAIDGDRALVLGIRPLPTDPGAGDANSALLYVRSAGAWRYDQTLHEETQDYANISYSPSVALRDGIAAVNFGGIFEPGPTGVWERRTTGDSIGLGPVIEYSNGRFAVGTGEGDWGAVVWQKNSAGVWNSTRVTGARRDGDNDNNGGSLALSGNNLLLAAPYVSEGETAGVRAFQNTGSWTPFPSITGPGQSTERVTLSGDHAFLSSQSDSPWLGVFHHSGGFSSGAWTYRGQLQAPDSYMARNGSGTLKASGNLVFQYAWSHDRGVYVYNVFQRDANGNYQHVAILAGKGLQNLGYSLDVRGNRVIVGSRGYEFGAWDNVVRIFELPANLTTANPFTDNFEYGDSEEVNAVWTQTPANQFGVRGEWGSKVYRLLNNTGDAAAEWRGSERRDQGIQAFITPRDFLGGGNRWVGLMTRRYNAQNYVYVTLRNSGRLELKRRLNGEYTTIASTTFPLAERQYKLRLESVGQWHKVYLDDALVLEGYEDILQQGTAGVIAYRALADYDNVILTSRGFTTVYADNFDAATASTQRWSYTGTGSWALAGAAGARTLAQTSTAGDARALIGAPVDDLVYQVRLRATAFGAGSNPWVGAFVRYTDDQNYVYVTFRANNTVSVRELYQGQLFVHHTEALPVPLGGWNKLRFEQVAIGLRIFVNDRQIWDANLGPPKGRIGLVTYRAAAQFDDFLAYQP
jgi:hypothetical protein